MKHLLLIALKLTTELLLFAVLSLCCAHAVFAQVIINEVMPAPPQGNEWVELKNVTDQSVSLAGWKIEDDAGVLTPTPTFSQVTVEPFGLLVFEIRNRLNNSGDRVLLRKPDTTQADLFVYGTSSSQQSWSRITANDATFQLATPTRGLENAVVLLEASPSPTATVAASISPTPFPSLTPSPVVSPIPSPSASPLAAPSPLLFSTPSPVIIPSPSATTLPTPLTIQLSEVVACAETGQPEWIELYNPNPTSVTLQGWKVKDDTGNSRSFDISLAAQSFGVIELSSAILNNDGDTLLLVDQNSTERIRVVLPSCAQGQSAIYTNLGWIMTNTVTKSGLNIFSSISPTSSPLVNTATVGTVEPMMSVNSNDMASVENATLPSLQQFIDQNTAATGITAAPDLLTSSPLPDLTSEVGKLESQQSPAVQQSSPAPLPSSELSEQKKSNNSVFAVPATTKTILLSISLVMVACGGYGVYEWYTEQRVKKTLDIL